MRFAAPSRVRSVARDAERPPLVMRCGGFGDMVLVTVLLRQLHARFGKPVDLISSGPWTHPLLDGHPALGRLFIIRSRRMPYWLSSDQRRLVAWLSARGPGPTWYCDLGHGKELLARSGIPDKYTCDARSLPWQLSETFADRYVQLGNHTAPAFEGVLPPAIAAVTRAAQLYVSTAARVEADGWLATHGLQGRTFVVVHPGSRHVARRWLRPRSGASKHWPEERWAQVLRAISERSPEHAILLSGSRSERRMNNEIMALAGVSHVRNVANDTPVRVLLPLLERADSMISVDTGPAHAAAALGCPTVSLFGASGSPILFRPGGATTPAISLTGAVEGDQSMLGISVESVVEAWETLGGRSGREPGGITQSARSVKSRTTTRD